MPAAGHSDSFMPVRIADVRVPAPLPTWTMDSASSTDFSYVGMNAPLPALTSMTRASRPAASFLDRIEPVIMATDSTVAVVSRML